MERHMKLNYKMEIFKWRLWWAMLNEFQLCNSSLASPRTGTLMSSTIRRDSTKLECNSFSRLERTGWAVELTLPPTVSPTAQPVHSRLEKELRSSVVLSRTLLLMSVPVWGLQLSRLTAPVRLPSFPGFSPANRSAFKNFCIIKNCSSISLFSALFNNNYFGLKRF